MHTLRKFLLATAVAALSAVTTFADVRYKELLKEDFSLFTAGSEESPSATTVNDAFQSIPSSKTLSPGWQGVEIYQAGGMAYQGAGGRLFTPDLNLSENGGTFRVTFRMKLAPNSPAGYANIVHSNISSYQGPDLTEEWQTITVEMSGGVNNDYICIRGLSTATSASASTARVYIDDILIEVPDPDVATPTSISYGDFDGTSFTATWHKVSGAQKYELQLYTMSTNGTPHYIEGDFSTTSNSYSFSGLEERWNDYYLQVRAISEQGESPWSSPLLIEGLPTPTLNDELAVTEDGFTASWQPVNGTYAYELQTYYMHTATDDEQFYHINTGFDFVTTDYPISGFDASFEQLPGWFFGCADLQDGYVGVQGAMAYLGYAAQIESPALNLSSSGGKLSVEFKAKNDDARTGIAVALYNPQSGDFVLADSYEYELSKNWYTVRASLTGGVDGSILAFIPTRSGNVYFDDVKVWQNIKPGAVGLKLADIIATQRTTATVSNLDCPEGDDVAYRIRARGISADQARWIYSAYSDLRYPYRAAAVEEILSTEEAPKIVIDGLNLTVSGEGSFELYNLQAIK